MSLLNSIVTMTKQITKQAVKWTTKHSPEILIGCGIVGMGMSIGLAVEGSRKADKALEDKKEELAEQEVYDISKKEVIKTVWKYYAPAAVAFVGSSCLIIGAHKINTRRNAVLAAAFKATETAYTEYRERIKPLIGEEKEKEVHNQVVKEVAQENTIPEVVNNDYIFNDTIVMYDNFSGRCFRSTKEQVRAAMNTVTKQMQSSIDDRACLNDFYYEIGLPPIEDIGDNYEWDINDLPNNRLEPIFDISYTENEIPCLVVNFNQKPKNYRHKR